MNENYFSKIDSEEKAYYLGVVHSIGSMEESKNSIIFRSKLSEGIEIIKNLSIQIYGSNMLKHNGKNYVLTICSEKIKNDLIKLGRTPNKMLSFCPELNDELEIHFVRGLFDMSGTCGFAFKANKYSISFLFSSDKKTEFLKKFLEKYQIKYFEYDYVMRIMSRKTCIKFSNIIYKNSSLFLKRKKEFFESLNFEKLDNNEVEQIFFDIKLIDYCNQQMPLNDIAEKFNVHIQTILLSCDRLGLKTDGIRFHYYKEYSERKLKFEKEITCTGPCKKTLPKSEFYSVQKLCKKCWSEKHKENYKNNFDKRTPEQIEKIRERGRKYNANRRKDPLTKIRVQISSEIRHVLQCVGSSKKGRSCMEFLPFTMEELKQHLEKQFEPWMNWDNRGKYIRSKWDDSNPSTWTWQLDHIIPHSLFNYTTMDCEEFRKCWSLSNLRPYNAKQNVFDGVSRIRHNIKNICA